MYFRRKISAGRTYLQIVTAAATTAARFASR
jgi:hypothetical protein